MGRRIRHVLPGGQAEQFSYDLSGNTILYTNFNGSIITNQFDVMNRLTNRGSIFGYTVTFAYSPTGQRTSMTDPSGATSYSYDNRDRLIGKTVAWTGGPTISLNYGYDANGSLTNLWSNTANGVNLTYSYDALNRLTNAAGPNAPLSQYAYDLAGNLQSMRYGNGVTNLYQYDSLNRLTNSAWLLNASSLASFYYQLGLTGNRTNLTELVHGVNRTCQWQYDSVYRLTNDVISGIGNAGYSYDAVGNRLGRTTTSTIAQIPAASYSYNTNDWLSGDAYDSDGNTVASGSASYQYDALNHLTNANGGAIVMTYDGDGNKMSKTVGGTTNYYLLDDRNPSGYLQVLEEWTSTGTPVLSKVYNYGLNLISQRQPGIGTNYFIWDGHGSTRMLTDASGNFVNAFAYDAYGTLIASNATPQTVYLYCGQQFDPDLGLYYNRARYLNTATGRFWSSDSYEGNNEDPLSLHKYLYAQDNPVDNVDPSGHDIGEMLAVADIFSGFFASIFPVTSTAFSTIAFPSTKYVYFSVDPTGISTYFNASAVQTLLQSELSANVFDAPPAGKNVRVSVHVEAGGPGTLGWTGTPKHTYVNRVRWDLHGPVASSDHNGLIQIDPVTTDTWTSSKGASPTAQTWVNIFAHEGIWRNAGNHWDHDGNPDGEISSGTGNALVPYTVLPSSRTTLRSDFDF